MTQRFEGLSLAQFKRLAATTGRTLRHQPAAIGLIGPLGAGKTTFVKNFARSLGIKKIKSPTFTIINNFRLGGRQLYHIDFYRLSKQSELKPLGVPELLKQKTDLILIEWLDKFPALKKSCDLIINISFAKNADERNITIYKN
ncbi:MAG: tRNA (adenosine(37)-N6)-threonylcarbamoyltransferase complex ATPase subunit type 1 TsaE [Candidatus Doudnabacteria bacterium]|nr:tRNA (adenosine(37)-N6)-threonylcarbamoyltransferase complex ATPase subunit type 1 TsaE [Candidatus Doudnabacteria bacterium]